MVITLEKKIDGEWYKEGNFDTKDINRLIKAVFNLGKYGHEYIDDIRMMTYIDARKI